MLVKTTSVLNFINILRTAFMHVDPKSVKRYWQLDWVLTLWGAMGVKDAHKHVGEIDQWCQFYQCCESSFYVRWAQKHKKDSQVISLFTLLGSVRIKAAPKTLMKSTSGHASWESVLIYCNIKLILRFVVVFVVVLLFYRSDIFCLFRSLRFFENKDFWK